MDLRTARVKLMDAKDEYLAERISVYGDMPVVHTEAHDRMAALWDATVSVVTACQMNKAPIDERAEEMVSIMMDGTRDEGYLIGWMCNVAKMEKL